MKAPGSSRSHRLGAGTLFSHPPALQTPVDETGCPIHRALCDGWESIHSASVLFLLNLPSCFLSGLVLVMMMLRVMGGMMMMRGGKGRAGKHHQQQGSGKKLFHSKNLARRPRWEKEIGRPASKQERVRRAALSRRKQRKLEPR